MARRRRRREPTNPNTSLSPDESSDESALSKDTAKPEHQSTRSQRSPQDRRGLGRGFWLYFAVMMAVLIPLNMFCLSNLDQGAGDAQEAHESPLLSSNGVARDVYATDPPTSGPRARVPARFGFHESTIADDVQVATLCAGYVIVHYNPSGGAALDAAMKRLAAELEGWDVVVHPDAQLGEFEVVLTSLLRMQQLDVYDKTVVNRFVTEYAGLSFPSSLCPNDVPG